MSKVKYIIIISILLLILISRFIYAYESRKEYKAGDSVSIHILLLTDIDNNSKNASFTTILPQTLPPQRVSIILPMDAQPHYGQSIIVSGKIQEKLLNKKSPILTVYYPKISITKNILSIPFDVLYQIRKKVISVFQLSLSDIDSSLLLGIVFGIKGNMPKSFMQQLQQTGLTHVIAASGMNVTMVAAFLLFLFTKYLRRQTATFLAILCLLIYAVFSGLQASIVRATIMGILAFSAQAIGKQYIGFYGLLLTIFVLLLYSPAYVYDVGFQLSVLATVGILLINPLMQEIRIIPEDISTTTAAQLATIPILIVAFGQYSLLSIITNALVLWTIPILMVVGSFGAFVGSMLPSVGAGILYLAIPFLWYFEAVVSFFSAMSISLQVSNIPSFVIIGYYFILIAIVWVAYKKRQKEI